MRVHMVGAVLRIVFDYEYRGIVPVGAVRNRFDNTAQRQIVIRHRGSGTGLSSTGAAGMVIGQIEQNKRGQFGPRALVAGAHKAIELIDELIGAELVGVVALEVGIIGVELITQGS